MKLAFNIAHRPSWDKTELVDKCRAYGFDGVELANLAPVIPPRPTVDPLPDYAKTAAFLREAGIDVVCLPTSAAFHARDARIAAQVRDHVYKLIDAAAKMDCRFVCILAGWILKRSRGFLGTERRETVIARISAGIRQVAAHAEARGVTLLIENTGDFLDSASMWHFVEAAGSPLVRCCWNILTSRLGGERPTTAIPRLASKIGMVRVCDAVLDGKGGLAGYANLGKGQVELHRAVQLLKGIGYRGYLVLDPPDMGQGGDADAALAEAAKYLRGLLDEKPVGLTAYKGDKFAPRQGYELAAK